MIPFFCLDRRLIYPFYTMEAPIDGLICTIALLVEMNSLLRVLFVSCFLRGLMYLQILSMH